MTLLLAILEHVTEAHLIACFGGITVGIFVRRALPKFIDRYPDILDAYTRRMVAMHEIRQRELENLVPLPLKAPERTSIPLPDKEAA